MTNDLTRKDFAVAISKQAGELAMRYFADRGALVVDRKGAQDWVSEADRNVETFIRCKIAETCPRMGWWVRNTAARRGPAGSIG